MQQTGTYVVVVQCARQWLVLLLLLLACCGLSLQANAQTESLDSLESKLGTLDGREKARTLYLLVNGHMRGDRERAVAHMNEVERWAESSDETDEVLSWLNLARGVYYSRTGMIDSAISCLYVARDHAEEGGVDDVLLRTYSDLGLAHIYAGKTQKAIDYLLEGLRVIKQYPDAEIEMKIHTNLVLAYLELKRYRDCIRQGRFTIALVEGTEFDYAALYSYNNIAICYGGVGSVDSARYYIEKGIASATEYGNNNQLANAYFILGKIYAEAGRAEEAIAEYLKARPYREKVGNPLFVVSDLYTLSDLYANTGQYQKGLAAGLEALALADKYNLQMKYDWTYLALARNYEGIGDFKNSSKYYRLWAVAKDSLYKHANAEAIAEMEVRFQTEKKEQALALTNARLAEQAVRISRNNIVMMALVAILLFVVIIFLLLRSRLRRRRELLLREAQIHAAIESQETERRRFARDLHDGMGQMISALRLALHRIHKDTPLDERLQVVARAEDLLNDMHREIRSIAFNLMPQTLVQNGLAPALREMVGRINDSERVLLRVNSLDLPLRLKPLYEISLYRIIQEWITNILKYADASRIEVQLVGYEDEITVTVEDDGKGFDVKVLTDGAGNGWKNIRSRANLIGAEVDVDSNPGRAGTTLIVRAPLRVAGPMDAEVAPNTH